MMRLPNEKGQGLVEYVLILVLVAVVVIAVQRAPGPRIEVDFEMIIGALRCDVTANNDSVSTTQNRAVTIAVLENDQYADYCGPLVTTELLSNATNGAVTPNAGDTFTYQPDTDFVGDDQFEYRLCVNGCDESSSTAQVTISVQEDAPDNPPPAAPAEVMAADENSSQTEQAIQKILEFRALALAQQDNLDQVQLILAQDALLADFVDVLNDLATEMGDADLIQALAIIRQEIKDGNYEALPAALSALGDSLPSLPLEIQITIVQTMGPGLANACQPLKTGQVPLTPADEALQLLAQVEAQQPGSTGQVIPLFTEARNQVETRNQIFATTRNGITTAGEFVATTLDILGENALAQQLRSYTQSCEGIDGANDLTPEMSGTVGNNGWYVDDVIVSWPLQPDWGVILGCQPTVIDFDTAGRELSCLAAMADGQISGGQVTVKRDATPPVLELLKPVFPLNVPEGSSVTFDALAQDNFGQTTILWDADNDGSYENPNPLILPVPGNLAGWVVPSMVVAIDEAGNETHLMLPTDQVNIINLAPNIDGWVVPTMIHFGGAVQLNATASDPGDDPLTASVDWGDGQIEPVVVEPDGNLQAEHTYAADGTYQVTLILSDDEGLAVSDSRSVMVYSPIQTIEVDLIPGTLNLVNQGILNQGEADSLVVKLEGAVVALNNDRSSAPQKLDAYLNEFEAIVPDASHNPNFLVATDVRDALILNGWVPEPD
jgi:Flp pilus assembly pilin Flp